MGKPSNEEFHAITKTSSSAGYVYVIAFGDCVKIGRAKDPKTRIMAIQTQSGRLSNGHAIFKCTDYGKCERGVHRILKEYRTVGEYFEVSLEIGTLAVQKFIDENNLSVTKDWFDKELVAVDKRRKEFGKFSKSILGGTKEAPTCNCVSKSNDLNLNQRVEDSANIFKSILKVAHISGLKGNQALIYANVATRDRTGIDLQALLDIELEPDGTDQLLTDAQPAGETVKSPTHKFDSKSIVIPIVTTVFNCSIQGMLLQYIFKVDTAFFDDCQMQALEDYIKNDASAHLFHFDKSEIDYVDSEVCNWYCLETIEAITKVAQHKFEELCRIVMN